MKDPYRETPTMHAQTCQVNRLLNEQEEYLQRYPNVCLDCHGSGEHVWQEMVGDPAHGYMQMVDICPRLDDLRCPRCDRAVMEIEGGTGDYFTCRSYHWTDSPGCATEFAPLVEDALGFLPCDCGLRNESRETGGLRRWFSTQPKLTFPGAPNTSLINSTRSGPR